VALGIGLDHRIGPAYLSAGPGFGGSCLPKDIQGLLHTTNRYGTRSHIVAAAVEVNAGRSARMVDKIADALDRPIAGSRIAVLGVTFKAGTDDVRYSPALDVITGLVDAGATVRLFDPQGMERAKAVLPPGVEYASGSYDAMSDADCVVIATEWEEFGALDLERVRGSLRQPLLVDLRNLYQPDRVAASGIRYVSIGRPAV
jgi:UDPglucose 6-dehydrogenase